MYESRTPVQQQVSSVEQLKEKKSGKVSQRRFNDQRPEFSNQQAIQKMANDHRVQQDVVSAKTQGGLPMQLKQGVEQLSGISMNDVKVHYNSSQPAQLQAHAYAQGSHIHLGPGQEKHLPHEAWHVVQQKQGRVQPTIQMKSGVPVNDSPALEKEADVMGAKALQMKTTQAEIPRISNMGHYVPVFQGRFYTKEQLAGKVQDPQLQWQTGSVNGRTVARRVEVKNLNIVGGTQGSPTAAEADNNKHSALYNIVRRERQGGLDLYTLYGKNKPQEAHDAHLLSERLHGPALVKNLVLVPKEVNMAMRGVEWWTISRIWNGISNDREIVDYEVAVNYGRTNMPTAAENMFPLSIDMRVTPKRLNDSDQWVDDRDTPPLKRHITVAVDPGHRGGGGGAGNYTTAGDYESLFSVEQLGDRNARAVTSRDRDLGLDRWHTDKLAEENSDAISNGNTWDYFQNVDRYKAVIRNFIRPKITENLAHLKKIALDQIKAMDIPLGYINKFKQQLDQTMQDADFNPVTLLQLAEENFYKTHPNPQAVIHNLEQALGEYDFWPQQHLEGLTDHEWYNFVEAYKDRKAFNRLHAQEVTVVIEDLDDSTPGVYRAESIEIKFDDGEVVDQDFLVDNAQFDSEEGLFNYIAQHLGVDPSIVEEA